jgi:hypothetical protein
MKTAQEMVALYQAAEIAVLEGKEYMLNGRRITREDLPAIRDGRKEWERKANTAAAQTAGNRGGYTVASWE